MARRPDKRLDPDHVLHGARSLISVLINYRTSHRHSGDPLTGVISRYAWGRDYHKTLKEKLEPLCAHILSLAPGHAALSYVDTGPVLEKWWTEKAGLGWIGKNANLITPDAGSWFFVGEILTTLAFEPEEYDPPFEHPVLKIQAPSSKLKHHDESSRKSAGQTSSTEKTLCGTCIRCLEVCPTRAIVAPFVVDARRCISYLTIELRGPIPRELRTLIGNRIFGCDDCQDVCPWNRFAVTTQESDFHPAAGNLTPSLIELLAMTREEFHRRFKESPIPRAKYPGFLRNVAVALGNSHSPEAVPALVQALDHPEPLVRQHVAWALGEIEAPATREALQRRLSREENPDVLEEIRFALERPC